MRNTLALVDPADGHVTSVVAENVDMEVNEVLESSQYKSNQQVAEECDEKTGIIAPVVLDASNVDVMSDPKNIRRVVLMNKAGDALVTGSGWIADGMIKGGNALARKITVGSRELESHIKPADNPVKISDETRVAVDKFGQVTGNVTRATTKAFDRAISAAIKGANTLYEQGKETEEPNDKSSQPSSSRPSETKQLGQSALKAIATVLNGTGIAVSAVGDSARTAIVDLIRKKYGVDAGYLAAKTLRATGNIAEMLIYFDARGIGRQVVIRGTIQLGGYTNNDHNNELESEYGTQCTDSPFEYEEPFPSENGVYPIGPPPPSPPRPSQYRKALDNDELVEPVSPTPSAPPPYPPRPTMYRSPTADDDDKEEKEEVEEQVQELDTSPSAPTYQNHV